MSARDSLREVCAGGDLAQAQGAVREFLDKEPGSAAMAFVAREATKCATKLELPKKRVAVLASFIVDPLEPVLTVTEFLAGRQLTFRSISYGQWYNALFETGQLDEFGPDVVLLLLHLEDVVPLLARRHLSASADLGKEADQFVSALDSSLQRYRARATTPVFLSTFIAATRGVEKHFDRTTQPSRQKGIDALNLAMVEIAGKQNGVYLFDYAQTVTDVGRQHWFDQVRTHHVGVAIIPRALPHLGRDLSEVLTALWEPRDKLVALDLDNTLWHGIAGEDGPDGVLVGGDYPGNAFSDFQSFLANLRSTGTTLVIVSKNNLADVKEIFEHFSNMPLAWEDFAAHRVNWEDKSTNLESIAEELSLGIESFVFVDDMPLERDLVRNRAPAVSVVDLHELPSRYAETIMSQSNLYSLTLTKEDQVRAVSYAADRARRSLKEAVASEDFFASLNLQLTIRSPRDTEFERIAQLFGKTNQFNLTAKRYDIADVEILRKDPATRFWIAQLSDRYGEYGLVGVALTIDHNGVTREIDSLLFSCRALGRHAEDALLAEIELRTQQAGFTRIVGYYRSTKKNALVENFFPTHGYAAGEKDGEYEKVLDADSILATPEHITILREQDN